MKFKGNLVSLSLDFGAYRKALHEQLNEDLARAAFAWLDEALKAVPEWSGASRATFLQLARQVGFNVMINPKVISRESFGASHGKGKIVANPQKGIYTFTYSTDLSWLVSNEYKHNTKKNDPSIFHRLIRPGPYGFQKRALEAFEREAKQVRLPSPWKFLKKTNHRV